MTKKKDKKSEVEGQPVYERQYSKIPISWTLDHPADVVIGTVSEGDGSDRFWTCYLGDDCPAGPNAKHSVHIHNTSKTPKRLGP